MKQLLISATLLLALASCESREEQYAQDLINSVEVRAMTGNSVTTTAGVSCDPESFTSSTVHFAVCYVVNIAKLPEIDDIRYDSYEFYAEKDGVKYTGNQAVEKYINANSLGVIDYAVSQSISVADLRLLIPQDEIYLYKFYVETVDNKREIKLGEVYNGMNL